MSTTPKSFRLTDDALADIARIRQLSGALARASNLPDHAMSDAAVIAYALMTAVDHLEALSGSMPAMQREAGSERPDVSRAG